MVSAIYRSLIVDQQLLNSETIGVLGFWGTVPSIARKRSLIGHVFLSPPSSLRRGLLPYGRPTGAEID